MLLLCINRISSGAVAGTVFKKMNVGYRTTLHNGSSRQFLLFTNPVIPRSLLMTLNYQIYRISYIVDLTAFVGR